MIIDIANLGGGSVLAGAGNGRQVFLKLLEETQSAKENPEVVYLDFEHVDVATASFIRESVLAFRDRIRSGRSPYYPVVANANEMVKEEFAALMALGGDAIMTCARDQDGDVTGLAPIGTLDTKQKLTFDLVTEHGETNARDLWRDSTDEVSQTAWNNRLANLVGLGLVMEVSEGRSKRYRTLLGGC